MTRTGWAAFFGTLLVIFVLGFVLENRIEDLEKKMDKVYLEQGSDVE